MKKLLNKTLALKYKRKSQKIRVMSEAWAEENIFCPNCGNEISNFENNRPVADFYCKNCSEEFELKAEKNKISKKIPSGSYVKSIERLEGKTNPNLFFMVYLSEEYLVNNFFVVPKYFFVPNIIEKRKKALKGREKYFMSDILFWKIPNSGKIYYIENGKEFSKEEILEKWQKTAFVKDIKKDELKGWIFDILNCVESLNKKEFELKEIYNFEKDLKILHPENNNIKAKIRQQLQFLRDKNYLEFIDKGKYRLK